MKRLIISAALLLSLSSCLEEGDYYTVLVPPSDDGGARISCVLTFGGDLSLDTRSILGGSVESKASGGVVAVYDSSTGKIDSEWEVSDFSKPLTLKLPCASKLDFFVVGNMWHISSDGSRKRVPFPENERDVVKMTYRMDGSAAGAGRTETFAEASQYGIPAAGSRKGVDILNTPSVSIELRRLFAKVTLTIDHSGLDGGINPDYFRNTDLYLRQANILLSPFGVSKPSASADVVAQSDYDASMDNGHSLTYTFYAPENRHSSYPTYVEFSGFVDSSAGGYGGSVRYRFNIGSGADGDYDVEGNRNYRIVLGFKAGSLFDPEWSVTVGDDWTDGRAFGLSADQAGAMRLGRGQVIAVRKNRDANCWLYYNRHGSGTNEASMLEPCSGGYSPSDLTKGGWWCEAPDLARYGITMSFSSGKLNFHVSDPSRFVAGVKIPLKLHLYPGDIVSEAELTTYDDIKVTVTGSGGIDEVLYVGMKRSVSVSGLAGRKVYYWNGSLADRLTFKTSTAPDAAWIRNSRRESQTFEAGGTLDLCAYATSAGDQFVLKLASEDTFNDGESLLARTVHVNQLEMSVSAGSVTLPFDGRDVEVPFDYLDKDGRVIPRELFDDDIFEQVLVPAVIWPDAGDASLSNWRGNDGTKIWLNSYNTPAGNIADKVSSTSGFLGVVNFGPSDSDAAYGITGVFVYVHPPVWARGFSDITSDYFNVAGPSDIYNDADLRVYDDSPFITALIGRFCSGTRLSFEPANAGYIGVRWRFSDDNHVFDGNAPVGEQTVRVTFSNVRSGETYILDSKFKVTHNITLRPFAIMEENSRFAQVAVIPAKCSWFMKSCCESRLALPEIGFLADIGQAVYRNITFDCKSCERSTGSSFLTITHIPVYNSFSYEDFKQTYYAQTILWTRDRIQEYKDHTSVGYTPLISLRYDVPSVLPAVAGIGCVNVSTSVSSLGCCIKT